MNPVKWAVKSIRQRGLLHTVQVGMSVFMDIGFDLRYGTNTMGWVQLQNLDLASENKVHGAPYQATKAGPWCALMRRLALPKDGVFVDLGSGKGRVLLLAAKLGFSRIVGVEFSSELCAIASRNVAVYSQRTGITAQIDIVESDVVSFSIVPEHNVFFMYNPFSDAVMIRVLDNLRSSVHSFPRRIWLIYNTPKHSVMIGHSGLFTESEEYEIRGNKFCVFHN